MKSPTVTRRGALLGAGSAALAAASLRQNTKAESNKPMSTVRKPTIDGQALLNRSRAQEILERFDLAGLVAADPINVYYLTNVNTIGVGFRQQHPGYATLSRNADAPPYLISHIVSGYDIANQDRTTAELITHDNIWPDPIETHDNGLPQEPGGVSGFGYHVLNDVPLTPREKSWRDIHERTKATSAANTAWAIARALKAQGVTKGRVAVDDMRIAQLLSQTDLVDVECVPGYEVFQLIRMVKSEQELAYQKVGGWNNGEACLATVYAIEAGMTHEDIEHIFRLECAKRGNQMATLVVGMPGGGLPDGVIVPGKPYLIDCVSHFKQYHGDTARTFVVGEPTQKMRKRFKANSLAREAVFDALRPGTKFSTLARIGVETMLKSGIPRHAIFVTPHTVGLQHGDNPKSLSAFGIEKIDTTLEEDMVLTVDLPFLEVGWGQGHNEDLVRITKTGYELFSPEDDPYIVL